MECLSDVVVLQENGAFGFFASLLVLAIDLQGSLARIGLLQSAFGTNKGSLGGALFFRFFLVIVSG